MTLHTHDHHDFQVDDLFTQAQQFDTIASTLRGLIASIEADQTIIAEQAMAVDGWIDDHGRWFSISPLSDIKRAWSDSISDGVLSLEERADLLRRLDNLRGRFYHATTTAMQELHGIMGGIAVDAVLTDSEISALSEWIDGHSKLRGFWPFDEVDALITALAKQPEVRHHLLAWCAGFLSTTDNRTIPADVIAQTLEGTVCACQPSISFNGSRFCVTGASQRAPRREIERLITARYGHVLPRIRSDLNYLIYCANGNPTWAYGCYGRKVEQVAELRRGGHPVVIVHENDFWDAIQDHPIH